MLSAIEGCVGDGRYDARRRLIGTIVSMQEYFLVVADS